MLMKILQISSNLDNLHLHRYWCCQTNCCHCCASQHEGKCRIKTNKKKPLEQSEVSSFYLVILTSIIRKEKKEKNCIQHLNKSFHIYIFTVL